MPRIRKIRKATAAQAHPAPAIAEPADVLAALIERIDILRQDIDRLIDERVETEAAMCEGVPRGVIRNLLTQHDACRCSVIRRFSEADAKAAEVAAAQALAEAAEKASEKTDA